MQYSFILKDNNKKNFRQFVWFLFFLHILAAGIIGYNATDRDLKLSLYILIGIYAFIFFIYFFFRMKKGALENFSFIMAVLYANFWMKYVDVTAMCIFLVIYLFITIVQHKKTTVKVSDEGVYYKKVFRAVTYSWQELENVILKDELLTIDLRSNKLIQAEITEGSKAEDEEVFNLFCKEQLKIAVK